MSSALSGAEPKVLWLDTPDRPGARPALLEDVRADLVIVGGGFTGLWAAFRAKERFGDLDVVVIDAGRLADQASGRNGGFCSSSLTHGIENGLARFEGEMDRIERLAAENFAGIAATIEAEGIDCDWRPSGQLSVATAPHLVEPLAESAQMARRFGHDVDLLDCEQVRGQLDSPTYFGGLWLHSGEALVDPARLGWGLAAAAERRGVRIAEQTSMTGLERDGAGVRVSTTHGTICAGAVILATNAFRSPVKAINRRIVPVYDHVLATEPLSESQVASIGWTNGQGLADTTNQFHYYRMTADRRILWGGYDASYHFGNGIDERHEQSTHTHGLLAEQFFETFPQLDGLAFTHRWGGVIDTSTRFAVGFGTALDGRVAYAVGYTGLGVGATRFGADVCLDLLYETGNERLTLDLVRKAPLPFPPEPLRWIGIQLTRRELARADRNQGKRGLWLRALDAVGLGFDS